MTFEKSSMDMLNNLPNIGGLNRRIATVSGSDVQVPKLRNISDTLILVKAGYEFQLRSKFLYVLWALMHLSSFWKLSLRSKMPKRT